MTEIQKALANLEAQLQRLELMAKAGELPAQKFETLVLQQKEQADRLDRLDKSLGRLRAELLPRTQMDTWPYQNADSTDTAEISTWAITIGREGVSILRLHEGEPIETYRKVPHSVAAVWLAAISLGFQPPRDIRGFD